MSDSRIGTYNWVNDKLIERGFIRHILENKDYVYKHANGAMIVLPIYPQGELIRPLHRLTVDTALDDWGFAQIWNGCKCPHCPVHHEQDNPTPSGAMNGHAVSTHKQATGGPLS